jgi:hypothetical protein
MDQQSTARATVSKSRKGAKSSSLGIGNPTAAYAQSESTSSQRIDVTVLLASSSVACHDDKCLNDTRGHAAIDEIAEDFASQAGPDSRGLRDSRHRCTIERLTPSACAASRECRLCWCVCTIAGRGPRGDRPPSVTSRQTGKRSGRPTMLLPPTCRGSPLSM